ncbi:hypothetical protein [Desulfovibrio psychrotolerans]|uniref:Uncharacterized protein n=1 Tax=Desulfovibrio psychrotolerans TaxID=415242 RepID=A0A7J0BZ96_9BACT|nr:hypothetical protein [Desulfovibrio psychrotolerans]GFM38294.1 hypothetical protein DSM19430T_29780 [Desulfovibrio psychrotolerans]
MKGIVIAVNRIRGMVAVQLEDGDHIVFESLGGDFSKGDIVSNIKDEHGDQEVMNVTEGSRESIYVEALNATIKSALTLIS